MLKHQMILALLVSVIIVLSAPSLVLAQNDSQSTIPAIYKDATVMVYDQFRGTYGRDYSYDWESNKYRELVPSVGDVESRSVILLDGELSEDIWKEIDPISIDLVATTPWGGAIDGASVRAANNGSWIFMAFQWEDTTESRSESSRIKSPDGAFFYNATHFYSDNFFVGWWMKGGEPTVDPWFNAHFAGTTKDRVPWKNEDPEALASLWIYKAYYTDDEAQKWPRPYFSALENFLFGQHQGEELIVPYPHMIQMYLNSTANYAISYMTHISGCAFPDQDFFPYEIRANGQWVDGVYTLEVARPFEPHPQNELLEASPKFENNKDYWVFIGAADGQHGENEEVGSISQWYTLSIQPSPQSLSSSSPIIPLVPMAAVGAAAVVAVVGVVFWGRRRR